MHAACMQAPLDVRNVMTELKLLDEDGPLGHLKIGDKIGAGGFGVVHAGKGCLFRNRTFTSQQTAFSLYSLPLTPNPKKP